MSVFDSRLSDNPNQNNTSSTTYKMKINIYGKCGGVRASDKSFLIKLWNDAGFTTKQHIF